MNKTILSILLTLVCTLGAAQGTRTQLIRNGGFEQGQSGKPTRQNEVPLCSNWDKMRVSLGETTPDWYGPNYPVEDERVLVDGAYSGNYSAGFFDEEGIWQKLPRKLRRGEIMKVSLYSTRKAGSRPSRDTL